MDRVRDRPGDSEAATAARADAYRQIERGLWSDVPLIPFSHATSTVLWRDVVDYRPPGATGRGFASHNRSIEGFAETGGPTVAGSRFGSLDPVAGDSRALVVDVFDTLFSFPNGAVRPEPLLVEDHAVSEARTTHTLQLKQGVRFHDGTELTAADVVYSFRRAWMSENSATYEIENLGIQREYEVPEEGDTPMPVAGSLGVRATGTHTVEIDLEAPHYAVPELLAVPELSILPAGIVGDHPDYEGRMSIEEFVTNPVGSGPFRLAETEDQATPFHLRRFEDYHGEVASVDQFTFADSVQRYHAFADGETDILTYAARMENYDPTKVQIQRTDERGREIGTYGPLADGTTANVARVPSLLTTYIGFDCEEVPLAVRRALAFLMDRSLVVRDRDPPAYHLTPPSIFPGGRQGYRAHYRGRSRVPLSLWQTLPLEIAVSRGNSGN